MELLYLWIGHYNNIVDTGFSFSTEYIFDYNCRERNLVIQKKESAKPNLFNNAFLNINAIIGKNGSAKSSLLTFIQKIFSKEQNLLFALDFLLITKNQNGELFYILDDWQANINIIGPKSDLSIEIKGKSIVIGKTSITELIDHIDLAFFSNSFSIYDDWYYSTQNRFFNVSFQYLLSDCIKENNRHIIERLENLVKSEELDGTPYTLEKLNLIELYPLSILRRDDLRRKIKFISEFKKEKEFSKIIPERVEVSFNINEVYRDDDLWDKLRELGVLEFFNPHGNAIYEMDENGRFNQKEWFKNGLTIILFLYTLNAGFSALTKNLKEIDIINELKEIKEKKNIPTVIYNFIQKGIPFTHELEFGKIQLFLKELEAEVDNLTFGIRNSNRVIDFLFDSKLSDFLIKFSEISYNSISLLNFNWHRISAGESALLTIFSRLNDVSSLTNSKFWISDDKDIWILIDEGDLYLHPEWQRTFLNDLHKYLPLFFTKNNINKKIQLFLTSHSPFIVSDLPKENIILLDKDEETGLCKVVDQDVLGQTFGANIHTLFKESFFLENGTMGEFAKTKILNLINFLKEKKKRSKKYGFDQKSSQKLISMIGEPLIKNQLQDMWDENFIDEEEMKKSKKELAREVYDLKFELDLKIKENEADKIK